MNDQPTMPPAGDEKGSEGIHPSPLATDAAERIAVIIDAVERAAAGVIDDAEAQAREYLAQSRRRADRIGEERLLAITELSNRLIDQAEEVKRQSDILIATFDQAVKGVEGLDPDQNPGDPEPVPAPISTAAAGSGGGDGSSRIERRNHLQPVNASGEREKQPEPSGKPPRVSNPGTAGTRLLVTQMAMSGSSRDEIESRLRHELGVQDAAPILDAILGPEG